MPPLLLSPAGTPEALYAAVNAGADEVYFGLPSFNARQNARNFTRGEARDAIRECRRRGVKTNITLNTLVTDRELPEAVKAAYEAACDGADAFIVQDIGLARTLKRAISGITLHASTQCACHSADGAKMLTEAGFDRVVLAREMDKSEIEKVVKLGAETEIFVHGALCVCHSGQCLMSAVIGKRSGNRGLCAQPCRLPYEINSEKKAAARYPLSLKDLSLAAHIPEIAALGVTSLKIEGRMKPPSYVSAVTAIFRKLLDENRAATIDEYDYLTRLFSREGFTDGYFTGAYRKKNTFMYGVRREEDKESTRELKDPLPVDMSPTKRAVTMTAAFEPGRPAALTLSDGEHTVDVSSDDPVPKAESRPMDETMLAASLTKLGDTPFKCTGIHIDLCGDVFVPKSALNALRRKATDALLQVIDVLPRPTFDERALLCEKTYTGTLNIPSCRLYAHDEESLARQRAVCAGHKIDSVVLPLAMFADGLPQFVGKLLDEGIRVTARMPRVVFFSEREAAIGLLRKARDAGVTTALADNIGHLPLIREAGLAAVGGEGLCVYNSHTLAFFAERGVKDIALSPELNTAQIRDILRPGGTRVSMAAGGRLELMVLESCVVAANTPCCHTKNGDICATLTDRTGARFPVRSEHRLTGTGYPCRNILLNSVPVHIIDKPDELQKARPDLIDIFET